MSHAGELLGELSFDNSFHLRLVDGTAENNCFHSRIKFYDFNRTHRQIILTTMASINAMDLELKRVCWECL